MEKKQVSFLTSYFRGIGQIMLQENAWTGVLFLAGIFCGSYVMGIAAALSALVGMLTAKVLKYDEREINAGLYGFSATLVGVALAFFFQPAIVIWIAIIIGSALAAIITHVFISRKIPGFTFPFIFITWILLYIFHNLYPVDPSALGGNSMFDLLAEDEFTLFTHGFGEVIFQGSILAGILFFIGVYISSPIAALYGLFGSIISGTLAYHFSQDINSVHIGLFSFNAVLCAITFAGPKIKDGLFVLFSVVLCILIQILMLKMNFSVLTFPFVAAAWVTLVVKHFLPKQEMI